MEPETISYFYAPPVQNLLKTYNEMADEIRQHLTKSHVQEWASDNHLNFIKDYTSLAHRPDFSYGYVWYLKCRYLQRLHKILDKVSIKDARYTLYQTGPTWTLIFDGNEISGLTGTGFKYINFLVQHANQPFQTSRLDSLLDSPKSDQDKDEYDGLSRETRQELFGPDEAKVYSSDLTEEEKKQCIKEIENLKEYQGIIRRDEEMDQEDPGRKDINPVLLKEAKKETNRIIKYLESKLKYGHSEYEKKEMIKKQQQRISKSIERAVKKIEKYDNVAFEHFMEALGSINSKDICYGTSKNIKWETK